MSHLRTAFFALVYSLGVLLSLGEASATVIFVVVKPKAIYVGADSLRTDPFRREWSTVCKAHKIYGGVLLKYGSSEDTEKTYSTDNDVEASRSSNKTFAGFQKSMLERFMKDAETSRISLINAAKRYHSAEMLGDATTKDHMDEMSMDAEIGLVFLSVVDGKLTVQELLVGPTPEPVAGSDGLYRLVVKPSEWHTRKPTEEVLIYGPRFEDAESIKTDLISNPSLIARKLSDVANIAPCNVGKPFTLLTVTVPALDPKKHYKRSERKKLLNTAHIDGDDGACPSWAAIPTTQPAACHR
jgi:hypothetical protein